MSERDNDWMDFGLDDPEDNGSKGIDTHGNLEEFNELREVPAEYQDLVDDLLNTPATSPPVPDPLATDPPASEPPDTPSAKPSAKDSPHAVTPPETPPVGSPPTRQPSRPVKPPRSGKPDVETFRQSFSKTKIRINVDGDEHEYDDWEDVPPDQQAQFEAFGFKPQKDVSRTRATTKHGAILPPRGFRTQLEADFDDIVEDVTEGFDNYMSRRRRRYNGLWYFFYLLLFGGVIFVVWRLVSWIWVQYQDAIQAAQI